MIEKEDLRQINMLDYLTDQMLDQLIPIVELFRYEENEYIFQQGDRSSRFYMLRQGKVLLELKVAPKVTVLLSAVKDGYSFGWSAMFDEERYTVSALCAEPCDVFSFREDKLKALFEKNHSLGFIMSQGLLRVIKKRYDIRTEQFIKIIRHHPDLGILL